MSFAVANVLAITGPLPVLGLGAVGFVLLTVGAYRLRETTLVAAAVWGTIAIGLLTYSCAYAATLPSIAHDQAQYAAHFSTWSYLRYAAAALVIAPTLAQLGAKSPQNGAWQFIVVTLAVVLLLPVGQGWAYGDEAPIVHSLIRWLLLAHVFLGVGNYVATRFGASAILLGIGELALIVEYLPIRSPAASAPRELFGLTCLVAAIGMAFVSCRLRPAMKLGVERLWADFRDSFGAVWTLRIAERLNVSAKLHRWPVEFAWRGVTVVGRDAGEPELHDLGGLDPTLEHRIERELRSYLRRFASHDWIARRLPRSAACDSPAGEISPPFAVESGVRR